MRKKIILPTALGFIFLLSKTNNAEAQFSLNGQLRTRTELRNGYGTLNKDTSAAFFTSQRTRLTFGYKWDRLNFNVSVQDVRVWGQDASSINNADGNRLMIHEAWAEVTLLNINDTTIKTKGIDNLSLKIGRQALIYDDVRLLGDLDWLQQARRHDAILLKAMHHGWQFDLGAGFNQNNDNVGNVGTGYLAGNVPAYITNSVGTLVATPAGLIPLSTGGTPGGKSSTLGVPVLMNNVSTNGMNQEYKAFQMLYVSHKFGQTKFSGLFFKDDFGKFRLDSVSTGGGYVYGRRYDVKGVNSRITYGGMLNGTIGNASSGLKKNWQVAAYFQTGKDKDGKDMKAQHYSAFVMLQTGKFTFGPGIEYLSGNEPTTPTTENHKFDPLYGTPHKHWGYMDYFYVATGAPVGGLLNPYFKTKFTTKDFFVSLDIHNFQLAKPMLNTLDANKPELDKNMGFEFDFIANYTLNKFTTLEAGYSFMKATNTLEFVKRGTLDSYKHTPTWAYLMINIRPDFFFAKPVAIKQ